MCVADPNGMVHLDLPRALASSYQAAGDADLFAVRSSADNCWQHRRHWKQL
jgi:hypothetical protein